MIEGYNNLRLVQLFDFEWYTKENYKYRIVVMDSLETTEYLLLAYQSNSGNLVGIRIVEEGLNLKGLIEEVKVMLNKKFIETECYKLTKLKSITIQTQQPEPEIIEYKVEKLAKPLKKIVKPKKPVAKKPVAKKPVAKKPETKRPVVKKAPVKKQTTKAPAVPKKRGMKPNIVANTLF